MSTSSDNITDSGRIEFYKQTGKATHFTCLALHYLSAVIPDEATHYVHSDFVKYSDSPYFLVQTRN